MGLLDALLGSMMGGMSGGQMGGMGGQMGGLPQGPQAQNPLLMLALQLLQQNGGLEGLLGRFQQAGYGQQAQSWVGTGQNLPIDPNVLTQIFGREQMGQVGQQFGMSTDEASGGLAQMLPDLIDQVTPQGRVTTDSNDLVGQALAILQQQGRSR